MAPLRTTKSLTILLVLVTITVVAMLKGCKASSILPQKTKVQIFNSLQEPQILGLHCKSKRDDKGEHSLNPGEDYMFGFKPNILLKVTLYFCNFWWHSNMSDHWFDIYVQERDEPLCKFCSWKVYEERLCRTDDKGGVYCYPWDKIRPLTPLAVAPSITNSSLP